MSKNLSPLLLEAFPILKDSILIRQVASPIPLVPDTTFDIFVTNSQDFLALVTTDYADPYNQSYELKSTSGSYEFEFVGLQNPFSERGETIDIVENNEMDSIFFITDESQTHKVYYYVANLNAASVSKR